MCAHEQADLLRSKLILWASLVSCPFAIESFIPCSLLALGRQGSLGHQKLDNLVETADEVDLTRTKWQVAHNLGSHGPHLEIRSVTSESEMLG